MNQGIIGIRRRKGFILVVRPWLINNIGVVVNRIDFMPLGPPVFSALFAHRSPVFGIIVAITYIIENVAESLGT
jgi:hypothetical protein